MELGVAVQYVNPSYLKGTLTNSCKGSWSCQEKRLPSSDFCRKHLLCAACSNWKRVKYGEFCSEHTCKHNLCLQKAGGWGLCPSHTCTHHGCTRDTLPSWSLCKAHNLCKVEGCPAGRASDGLFGYGKCCAVHYRRICVYGDCLRPRASCEKYCPEHYREIGQKQKARQMKARQARRQARRKKSKQKKQRNEGGAVDSSDVLINVRQEEDGCLVS